MGRRSVGPICIGIIFQIPTAASIGQNGEEVLQRQYLAAPEDQPSLFDFLWIHRNVGASGLKKATEIAILNANYISKRLGVLMISYTLVIKGEQLMN